MPGPARRSSGSSLAAAWAISAQAPPGTQHTRRSITSRPGSSPSMPRPPSTPWQPTSTPTSRHVCRSCSQRTRTSGYWPHWGGGPPGPSPTARPAAPIPDGWSAPQALFTGSFPSGVAGGLIDPTLIAGGQNTYLFLRSHHQQAARCPHPRYQRGRPRRRPLARRLLLAPTAGTTTAITRCRSRRTKSPCTATHPKAGP
ncbi:non-reducing end alpha-L-arabinofuranosidase family hydrolase [Streptomyces qaidamensis]|uniref:non-reducing end alpha-L-arabinofuranosidase family hydrolase n=1 Tax=Streptomyces qaidamensis TaxID=1783515 RepID=UPI00366182D6